MMSEGGVVASGSGRLGVGRRLIGWVAAYALALHAMLAGVVTTQLAARNLAAHGLELCLTDPDGTPAPGHHSQHEDCAIHCNTVASGAPVLATAIAAPAFPLRAASPIVYSAPTASFDLLRRAGLGSRAPPAA
jgi:hypothetical protein